MASPANRIGLICSWVMVGGLLAGCAAAPPPESPEKPRTLNPRISDDLLQDHGLESLCHSPPDAADNPVQGVELLPEGLFVATQPVERKKGRLKLLSLQTAMPIWFFALDYPLRDPPSVFRYPQGVAGKFDEVYFAQMDRVRCVDLRYGSELWSAEVPHSVATRVVADEFNYFLGSDNGRAYGFRKKQGVEVWTYRTRGTIDASPVVLGSSVFFASRGGSVYRLFSTQPGWITGESWEFPSGARIVAEPTLYSRWILVGSTDYKLYCLETQDGTEYWAFQAGAPIEEKPVVYSYRSNQEFVYCVSVERTPRSETRTLFAVRLRDGQEVWRQTGLRRVVSMGKDTLYAINDPAAGAGRFIVALDVLTGTERFRIPIDGFDFVPHNSADSGRNINERGKIYLVCRDGTVQVLREKL